MFGKNKDRFRWRVPSSKKSALEARAANGNANGFRVCNLTIGWREKTFEGRADGLYLSASSRKKNFSRFERSLLRRDTVFYTGDTFSTVGAFRVDSEDRSFVQKRRWG